MPYDRKKGLRRLIHSGRRGEGMCKSEVSLRFSPPNSHLSCAMKKNLVESIAVSMIDTSGSIRFLPDSSCRNFVGPLPSSIPSNFSRRRTPTSFRPHLDRPININFHCLNDVKPSRKSRLRPNRHHISNFQTPYILACGSCPSPTLVIKRLPFHRVGINVVVT